MDVTEKSFNERRFVSYMEKIIFFFRLTGHWFPFQYLEQNTFLNKKNRFSVWKWHIYSGILIGTLPCHLIFGLTDFFQKLDQPQAAIKNAITTIYAIQTLGRVIFVAVYGSRIWQLFLSFDRQSIENTARYRDQVRTNDCLQFMQSCATREAYHDSLYIFLIIIVGSNLTGIFFTVTPFVISYNHAYHQKVKILSNETAMIQRPLVYDACYPFDIFETPVYEIVLAIQAGSGFVWINMMSSSDAVFFSILARTLAEIHLLIFRASKLHPLFSYYQGFSDTVEKNGLLLQALKDWILHHQRILKIAEEIESTFSPFILMTFLFNGVSLSLLAYNAARYQDTISIISVCGYFCVVFIQLFAMSLYGQKVTDKSLDVKRSIYSIPWWKSSKYVQSSFKILFTRAEEPIVFTGMGYFQLSMEFLLSVFGTAFSYFIILIQLT